MRLGATTAAALALALALGVGRGAAAFVPDDSSAPHEVLSDALMRALDGVGIDVVGQRSATTSFAPSDRPRVALLRGFQGELPSAAWAREFQQGLVGAVFAVRADGAGTALTDASAFATHWNAAASGRRVFLSFTRADAARAQEVARALEAQGYVTFTYLNDPGGAATYDAASVQAHFASADHHLVIDTHNARRSEGVWAEANVLALRLGDETRFVPGVAPSPWEHDQVRGVQRRLRTPGAHVPGGIMFDGAAHSELGPPRLAHDGGAPDGRRVSLLSAGGGTGYVLEGLTSARARQIADFVESGNEVVVSIGSRHADERCRARAGTLGIRHFDLHAAFRGTEFGAALIVADELPLSLRRSLPDAATVRSATIHDRDVRVVVSSSARGLRWEGLPAIDYFSRMDPLLAASARRLAESSDRVTRAQAVKFGHAPSYAALLELFRGAALMRTVRNASAGDWDAFRASLPAPIDRQAALTPSLRCAGCSEQELLDWIRDCSSNPGGARTP